MKNLFKYVLPVAILPFLAGCSGNDMTEVTGEDPVSITVVSGSSGVTISDKGDNATVTFRAKGGAVRIDVKSTYDSWSVENGAQWLTIEEDMAGIVLSAGVNEGAALNATVTITSGKGDNVATATVTVNQLSPGDPDLELDATELVFAPGAMEPRSVKVTTNQDEWTFRTTAATDWLLINRTGDGLVFTADENPYVGNLSVEIEVIAGVGENTVVEKIKVVNEAQAYIVFTPNTVSLTNAGGNQTIAVTATQDWSITPVTETWLTAVRNGNSIVVTVDPNQDEQEKKYEIEVVCGTGTNTVTGILPVEQWSGTVDHLVLEYTLTGAATVTLPLVGTVNATVTWGDGNSQAVTANYPTHAYTTAGTYEVHVKGTVTGLNSESGAAASAKYITGVKQWGLTGLTSMKGAFSGCLNLTAIPGDTHGAFGEVTTFEDAFYGNVKLQAIPSDLLAYAAKAINCKSMFYMGSSGSVLPSIPAGLFDACTEVETFESVFCGNMLITRIPDGLFDKNTKATTFYGAFSNCRALTDIPAKFFKNNTAVTDFYGTFEYCEKLESIPADLFEGCVNVTSIARLFAYCKALQSVPEGIFDGMDKVITVSYLFYECHSLTSIPVGLFDNMRPEGNATSIFSRTKLESVHAGLFDNFDKVTTLSNVFLECSLLKSVPDRLFYNCTSVTNFLSVFKGCSSLETVGGQMFNCPGATGANGVKSLFENCTSLETVPDDVIVNIAGATQLTNIFSGCTRLKSVPAGIFDTAVNATTAANIFSGCSDLTTVPASIFDKNTKIAIFTSAFQGCTSLTGESPFTVVEGAKVHLYQRNTAGNGLTTVTTYTNCFTGCTGLDDYADIPNNWKGL